MRLLPLFVLLMSAPADAAWADCSLTADGHPPFNGTNGTFGPSALLEMQWDGRPLYVLLPSGPGAFPLLVFMHGSTGQYAMYAENLREICTHGFIVVFPFIKSPEAIAKRRFKPMTRGCTTFRLGAAHGSRLLGPVHHCSPV